MPHLRALIVAGLATLLVSACGKRTEAPATPADRATSQASAASTAAGGLDAAANTQASLPARSPVVDGSPLIATEPDGVHIEYRTYGRGDPAIVLIHGWATDGNYWNAQLDSLKAKYTVVVMDLAGHGASSANRTDWSMENYGEDVATVVRLIQNQQIILVGHSMGATVALEAAKRVSDRVIGIIAVDALKSIGLPPISKREIEVRVAPFRADFIGQTRKYVSESLFQKGADPLFVQKVAYDMSLEPQNVAVQSMQALLSMDFSTVLPDIHVPVLAINSDLTPTDEARIRKQLPDFQAQVLPHTGHFLMMDATQRFNPVLLRDIDTLVHRARH